MPGGSGNFKNTMARNFSNTVKELWDKCNIRFAVLTSLFFQIVLIFLGKSRKRTGNSIVIAIIWSFYLLADWLAANAVGLISKAKTDDRPKEFAVDTAIAAFWASFLLVHLGGPDTITAFSIEDNQLWFRNFLKFVIQLLFVVFVFWQSTPNELWIPTVLVFFAGAMKYGERMRAMYKASLSNFKRLTLPKPDPGPNYAQLMEEYSAIKASNIPVEIEPVKETERRSQNSDIPIEDSGEPELEDIDVLLHGYRFFQIFKGLIVESIFSFQESNESKKFFSKWKAIDAFKVMEVELNFIYDALYTKMDIVHNKLGYFFRFIYHLLILVSLQQFWSHSKHGFYPVDVVVTYILLIGAVGLDVMAFIYHIFSDWMIVFLNNHKATKFLTPVLVRISSIRRSRWSNTMSQHNLINFCLNERFRWIHKAADILGLNDLLNEFMDTETINLDEGLKKFIVDELKTKASKVETRKDAKEIYSAKGGWILVHSGHYPSILETVSDDVEYDESLLLWHIATELCYYHRDGEIRATMVENRDENSDRKFCKWISDYMLYLLLMRPTLMSTVEGIAKIRYQDTCNEAKNYFLGWQSELRSKTKESQLEFACTKLLSVNTDFKPKDVKGDRSKSVLFDACILAKELKKLQNQWEIMSKVWVELMSYAASHCRPDAHAKQISRGGELIVFVWLLMAHFGLGDQFRIESGDTRAKLVVTK